MNTLVRNISLAIVGVALLGTAAFYIRQYTASPLQELVQDGTGRERGSESEPIPDGFDQYRNPRFHFSLIYPETLRVVDEVVGGALLVTFQDEEGRGFQIYAFAYNEPTISAERFRKDIPSGVMKEPVEVLVAGVPAQMFFSTDASLGETREVWFIHKGVLYEVTTYKELDAWLSEIMRTWKFI